MNINEIKHSFDNIKNQRDERKQIIEEGDDIDTGDLFNDLDIAIDLIEKILPLAVKYDKFSKEMRRNVI